MEKQHKLGKLHALERICMLLDEDSFREIGSNITNLEDAFNIKKGQFPYDGVITGYGTIGGQKVVIYSEDFTVIGGTLGKQHGFKIANAIKMAIESRCPVIGINDSGGARIQEGVNALAGYGEIFYYNTMASGYIPQISIIAGNCAGGAVYSPGITDFIFVIDEISQMFVTGPAVIKTVTNEDVNGKWAIFFFYPADFTFVCPTELVDIAEKYEQFQAMGVEVYSVSTDSHFVHKAWHDASESIRKIKYPMLADPTGVLTRAFGVMIEEEGMAYRGTFVVNPEGKIKIAEIQDNNIGRNADELLRKVEAAQFVATHDGEVCPAKWKKGGETLKPSIDLVGKI